MSSTEISLSRDKHSISVAQLGGYKNFVTLLDPLPLQYRL